MPSTTPAISAVLAPADRTLVMTAIASIKEKMSFLVSLSPEEHVKLVHIKDSSATFDEGCAGYMASHPGFIPSFVDPAEVLKDRTLLATTRDIVRELKTLARSAEDTITLLSHEVYVADLAYYESVKAAAKRGALDADAIATDLGRRFRISGGNGTAVKPAGVPTA